MKSMMMYFAAAFFVSGIISCGDLDSFVEPMEPSLPRLPADDCGEFLTNVDNVTQLRWSGNGEEIYFDTWNSINACRLSDKSVRTVLGTLNSPRTLSVSDDGQKLYFTAMNEHWQYSLYVVSTSGGTPTLLREDLYSVFVSADQRVAAYSSYGSAYAMDLVRGTSRVLHTGEVLALSDDGAYAVVRDFPAPYYSEICYYVSTSTGAAEYFSLPSWNVWRYTWIKGELFAFIVEWVDLGLRLRSWRGSTGEYSSPVSLGEGASYAMDMSKDGEWLAWWSNACTSWNSWGGCDIQEIKLHGMNLATLEDTTLARAYTRTGNYGYVIVLSSDGQKAAFVVKGRLFVKEVG